MANLPFLLEPTFNFNPLLQQTFQLPPLRSPPIKLSYGHKNAFNLNYSFYKVIRDSPKPNTKCLCMTHNPEWKNGIGGSRSLEENDSKAVAINSGLDEVLWGSIKNVLKALQKPIITGVLLGLLLLYDHHYGCVALACTTTFEGAVGVEPVVGVKPGVGYGRLYWMMLLAFCVGYIANSVCYIINQKLNTGKTSVLKLQVGLLGKGKSLEMDLNRIAATDISTLEGLSYVLEETTLALLRHPEYCISGYSSAEVKWDIHEVAKLFNQLSVIERGKFNLDTLVNVNTRKIRPITETTKDFRDEYSVITIIVAAQGIHKLPPINSNANLKEALQILATIPSYSLEALAVLLTPQIENDTLTEQKFLENYSLLCPLTSPQC